MLKKIFHIFLAIVFIPVSFASAATFYKQIGIIKSLSNEQMYFFYGCIFYLIFHAVLFKPNVLYIFAHELMHSVAAILSGSKIKSFKVSPAGGSVTTTKTNPFISLAPYMFPFYTFLISMLYFLLVRFNIFLLCYKKIFLFLVGFTLAFHIILTIDFLKIRQTDLIGTGYIFSIELIFFVNVLITAFIFSVLFKEIIFTNFLYETFTQAKQNYILIFRYCYR